MKEEIQSIIQGFSQSSAGFLKVVAGGESLELVKKKLPADHLSSSGVRESKASKGAKDLLLTVSSKNVGRYCEPKTPLEIGALVNLEAVMGAIRSMGLDHDIISPYKGLLLEVHVQDGDVVEFGQPLFTLREEK